MRQRRRAERGRFGTRVSDAKARRTSEQAQQRLLLWGSAIFGVLLVLFLSIGWYISAYRPPRQTVAVIDGVRIQLRHLVPYTLLNGTLTGLLDPSGALSSYARDIILRNHAEGYSASEEEINRWIYLSFNEGADPETPPLAELDEETRRRMETFLDAAGISEGDYRAWVEGRVLLENGLEYYESQVANEMEQVFVRWIVTDSLEDATAARDEILAQVEAGAALEVAFASVAADANLETFLADEQGEVGWVPAGAIPVMDPYLFGSEEQQPVYGELAGPFEISGYGHVLLLVDGPASVQPVSDEVRAILGRQAFQEWMDARVEELVPDGTGLTQAQILWVLERFI